VVVLLLMMMWLLQVHSLKAAQVLQTTAVYTHACLCQNLMYAFAGSAGSMHDSTLLLAGTANCWQQHPVLNMRTWFLLQLLNCELLVDDCTQCC
jgi:hypothetical protein